MDLLTIITEITVAHEGSDFKNGKNTVQESMAREIVEHFNGLDSEMTASDSMNAIKLLASNLRSVGMISK